jgi:hypothetical protein
MIFSREAHEWKQSGPMPSTDAGMQIDFRDQQQQSISRSIRLSLQGDANVIVSREAHESKQLGPMNSTEAGMQTDFSEHFENAIPSIRVS